MKMENQRGLRYLPRNVWVVSLTSFCMDVSSEMVLNILPLYLANILGVRTSVIGFIEGLAESTASLFKLFSGWFSDRIKGRKWLAVSGYGLSALVKPLFYFASSWWVVAGARWSDRVGKGIRTAPRDALVADSTPADKRGLAFGFHRAADTAGALLGLLIAWWIVRGVQAGAVQLSLGAFRWVVIASLPPAGLAVLVLALGATETGSAKDGPAPRLALSSLGKPFIVFMVIVGFFELGNSSDAFLVLRAQERGLSVTGILSMLAAFNLVYALVSTPAGGLSDRVGRQRLIISGWLVYAAIYLGFGLAQAGWQVWTLYVIYGLYYGLSYGTAKALVADLVPEALRGTAYGTYNAVLGILDLPASLIAGILWQGAAGWQGFGPRAPFLFAASMALLAAILVAIWLPKVTTRSA
jgi:MFS family permease